jgi:hypothetical protein
MFHLKNKTPFVSETFVFPDRHGRDTLCVVVKATYDLKSEIRIAEVQQPIVTEDVYWGEPGKSSLKYPSEVCAEKPGTDVILIGEACAPADKPVSELFVGLSVAGRHRVLQVFGDRYWKNGMMSFKPSAPQPFVRMPIVYERAYGGMHVIDEATGNILAEARNPVGRGFWGKRSDKEIVNISVPNIEDPGCLMTSLSDKPAPAGYGAIASSWQPRASYAGTCDEAWQKKRAPLMPDDLDLRYFYTAHPDLIFSNRLKGGETFILANLSPRGKQKFELPANEPKVEVNITDRFITAKVLLDTVLLEPSAERFSMVWHAAAAHGRRITGAEVNVTL